MKTLKVMLVVWPVTAAVIMVIALFEAPTPSDQARSVQPDGYGVVGDLNQMDMLESDQRMLEQMRVSLSPSMQTMIRQDPMWIDPAMIRLQEEYQAQLDRMIGKRTGRP